tara:strand:+ start:2050 stop:2559 length:510 start_codon:yes stop_codon:yes gene_type:complete
MFKRIESRLKVEYGESASFRFGKFYIIINILSVFFSSYYLSSSSFNIDWILLSLAAIMIFGIIQTKKYGLYLLYGLILYGFIESIYGIIAPQEVVLMQLEALLGDTKPHPSFQGFTESQLDAMTFRTRFQSIFSILCSLYALNYFNKKKKIFINTNETNEKELQKTELY